MKLTSAAAVILHYRDGRGAYYRHGSQLLKWWWFHVTFHEGITYFRLDCVNVLFLVPRTIAEMMFREMSAHSCFSREKNAIRPVKPKTNCCAYICRKHSFYASYRAGQPLQCTLCTFLIHSMQIIKLKFMCISLHSLALYTTFAELPARRGYTVHRQNRNKWNV